MCDICDPKKKYTDCICDSTWENFNDIIFKLNNFNSEILNVKLKISTITLCCNFNSNIDLDKFYKKYKECVKYTPKTKNTAKVSSFYNSLLMNMSVKYQGKHSVSIKYFPNGKIQVAGLQSIKACAYCIRKAFNRLSKNGCFLSDASVTNPRIVMINSDFKINKNIHQGDFCEILSDSHISKNGNITQIIFQPSKYPAINVKIIPDDKKLEYLQHCEKNGIMKKFAGTISLLIFRSGSIIITGGRCISSYLEIYIKIINILSSNKNILYNQ
jgi:TATA-box binding protein (TBP) (component of TFIID and TFIIIB)